MKGTTQHNIFFLQIVVSCCCAKCRYAGCRYTESWRCTHLSSQDETLAKEYLLKGKNKYDWPPSTIYFRSAAFSTGHLYFSNFAKQGVQTYWAFPLWKGSVHWPTTESSFILGQGASVSVSIDKMICHRLNFGQIWSIFSDFIWQTNSFFQNVFY
jgi:hypothetical protein